MARRSLPVNLVESIARQILAQLLELPPAPDLPHRVHPANPHPQRLQVLRAPQIRISTNLHRHRFLAPHLPHPPRRKPFQINRVDTIQPPPMRRPSPNKLRNLRRQIHIRLFRISSNPIRNHHANPHSRSCRPMHAHANLRHSIFKDPHQPRQLHANPIQSPRPHPPINKNHGRHQPHAHHPRNPPLRPQSRESSRRKPHERHHPNHPRRRNHPMPLWRAPPGVPRRQSCRRLFTLPPLYRTQFFRPVHSARRFHSHRCPIAGQRNTRPCRVATRDAAKIAFAQVYSPESSFNRSICLRPHHANPPFRALFKHPNFPVPGRSKQFPLILDTEVRAS